MRVQGKIVVAALAGAALGAMAMEGLRAQGKPKAYLVTESEVIDAASATALSEQTGPIIRAAGGRTLVTARGTVSAVQGAAPARFSVSEWENIDKAKAYINSPDRKALESKREKAIKIVRQFIVEDPLN